MSEVQEVNPASSPAHSSLQQADRRVSLIFGQDLPDSTPDPTGDTIELELLPQGPQSASQFIPHSTGGTIGLELAPQGSQNASPSTTRATGSITGLGLPPQRSQDASPPTSHLTGDTVRLELYPQRSQDAPPPTPPATEDASERERFIQEIPENLPLQSPVACSDPHHPGHFVTGHEMPVTIPQRQVGNTDNNCIPQTDDANENQ